MNIHFNFCKGDTTKIKRNVVLGALGDFAGGGAPPPANVLSSTGVQNVQFPAIPIAIMATQPAVVNSSVNSTGAGVSSTNANEIAQIREDVNRLTSLVNGLVNLEKARSEGVKNAVDEAAK